MKNEYFEMNRLDSTNSLDTDPMKYKQTHSQNQSVSHPDTDILTDAVREEEHSCDSDIKQSQNKAVILAVIASVAVITAATVIIGIFISKNTDGNSHFDLDQTASLTQSNPEITSQSPENAIGKGVLFDDCDILSEPNRSAITVGRLAGETDVLVYASIGDYYKISDTNQLLSGYVLKEQVNIGDIDMSHADAPVDQSDDTP